MVTRLTEHFTLEELCASDKARELKIDNTPTAAAAANLAVLAVNVLEPLRELYQKPILVNSGYRCEKLNKAVGGKSNSQHLTGNAVDIRPAEQKDLPILCAMAKRLDFDQLLFEKNAAGVRWLHVSFAFGKNRHYVNENYCV